MDQHTSAWQLKHPPGTASPGRRKLSGVWRLFWIPARALRWGRDAGLARRLTPQSLPLQFWVRRSPDLQCAKCWGAVEGQGAAAREKAGALSGESAACTEGKTQLRRNRYLSGFVNV